MSSLGTFFSATSDTPYFLPSFIRSFTISEGKEENKRNFDKLVKGEFVCNYRHILLRLEMDDLENWLVYARCLKKELKIHTQKKDGFFEISLELSSGANEVEFRHCTDESRNFTLPLIYKGKIREQMDLMAKGLIQVTCFVTFCFQISFIPSGSMMNTLIEGDYILVDKMAFLFRQPRKNEIVTFDFPLDPSRAFIKRLIGLPGETIEVKDQMVYINNEKQIEPQTLNVFAIYSHEGRAELNPEVLFSTKTNLSLPSGIYAMIWPDGLEEVQASSYFALNLHANPPLSADFKDISRPKDKTPVEIFASPGSKVEKKGAQFFCNGKSVSVKSLRFFLLAPARLADPAGKMEPVLLKENEYIVMGDNRDNSQDSRFWGSIHRWDLKGKPLFRMIPLKRMGLIRP